MAKYKVTVKYDGSNFHGWAKQLNTRTVQGEIENNLKKIYGKEIPIEGSGRTDAYVHALGQVFSFKEKKISLEKKTILKALNMTTAKDVEYLKIEKVGDNFHGRFSVKTKTYLYIVNTNKKDIFREKYLLNYCKKIDLKKIIKASKLFVGKHNFLSFSTTEVVDTVRVVNWIKITNQKGIIKIRINGNGFLRNMVRMIVGTLIDINENKKNIDDIKKLLNNPKKGSAIKKVQGCGLYLEKVNY